MPLFNGKDLKGWKVTNFGGEGEVLVEKGEIVITQGQDLSGIHTERKDLPTGNYEVQFDAMRQEGSDFFAAITFPIGKSHCSLILGAGVVVFAVSPASTEWMPPKMKPRLFSSSNVNAGTRSS